MSYVGNLKYDEDILKTDRDIVIYGAGKRGKQVLDYLERNNCKNRVVAFCDKSKELQQKNRHCIPSDIGKRRQRLTAKHLAEIDNRK